MQVHCKLCTYLRYRNRCDAGGLRASIPARWLAGQWRDGGADVTVFFPHQGHTRTSTHYIPAPLGQGRLGQALLQRSDGDAHWPKHVRFLRWGQSLRCACRSCGLAPGVAGRPWRLARFHCSLRAVCFARFQVACLASHKPCPSTRVSFKTQVGHPNLAISSAVYPKRWILGSWNQLTCL